MSEEIITINLSMALGMGSVNCYLIKSEKGMVLVDTGGANARKKLVEALRAAGCKPSDLNLILLTHGDFDHSGNAAFIRQLYASQIGMHPADSSMIVQGDMFVNRGSVNILMRKLIAVFFGLKKTDRFTPDLVFQDGDELTRFGVPAEIVTLPGHSKGSIGVLLSNRDLICGDMLVNQTRPELNTLVDQPEVMSASLEKMKQLQLRMIYPGHGKPFDFGMLG